MKPRFHFALIAALFPASLVTPVANAVETPHRADERVVAYSDLDVTRSDDAAELYRRIESAARDACRMGPSGALVLRAQGRRCVEEAVAAALAEVNSPPLTARHRSR
jgi:UrcA family protein